MTDTSSPNPADLPLPDYDHLPTGSLQHRIRTLTRDQLQVIADYEQQHAHRPLVQTMIQARLAELDSGASPSGGDPAGCSRSRLRPRAATPQSVPRRPARR
jgi:hypothetical protein